MDGLRRDAARNRARILSAAQELVGRGDVLALNAVARAADVGVGTVYRHFATVDELEEVLVWDRFAELDRVLDEAGPDRFDRVLAEHVALLVADPLFEKVTAQPDPALPETASRRTALIGRLGEVLAEAQAERRVRGGIDANAVLLLACGAAHSIRSAGFAPDSDAARVLLEVILRGLRP
ncbi:TetR family transcriptional regulator [Herbiconiux sp.]|uniref:TetR/AcrR family transcriptional regulator n=1 Tax=Herbiconiux sp. TaxID=1871186 RepID=UPI0025C49D4A|nr:TetR family transcriptional regulator [Herbiconiux sp.]